MEVLKRASDGISKYVRQLIEKQISRVRVLCKYEKILASVVFVYIVAMSTVACLKYYCFTTQTFDFGIFVQISWQTVHGDFMFTQPRASYLHPTSFLGVHVSPLLLLIIAVYAIVRSAYALLVVQTIALGFAAFFIYKIGVKITEKKKVALLFAVGYLLYPGTLWPNWYDFHLEAFVPLFASMIFYYYLCGSKWKVIFSMILLVTTFERAVFIVIFFIIYIFLRELLLKRKNGSSSKFLTRRMTVGLLVVVAFSLAYFVLAENIMNGIWPERELRQPTKIFGEISYNEVLMKISYIAMLSAPLAFLSFDSPLELVPAIPYVFLAMASNYEPYFTVTWQYPALISVPFFVSAIFGWTHHNWKKLKLKLVVAMLLFTFLFSPMSPLMSQFSTGWAFPIPTLETQLKHQALSSVEENATVLAQENIFPNIAERKVAYTLWPNDSAPPDYIVVDVLDTIFYREPSEEPTRDALLRFIKEYSYGVFKVVNGFIILKRNYQASREVLVPLHFSLEFDKLRKQFVSFEDYFIQTHFFVPEWVEVEGDHLFLNKSFSGNSWWGPWVTVPPGRYRVEVQYSVAENVDGQLLDVSVYYWRPYPINETVYAEKVILGGDATPGERTLAVLEFELKDWVPALEVVGTSHGKADIQVYEVKLEEID